MMMAQIRQSKPLFLAPLALMLALVGGQTVQAQGRAYDPQIGNAVGALLGAMIKSGQLAEARRSWLALSPEARECADVLLKRKNLSTDTLMQSGVSASDARLSPVINFCNATINRVLRTNYACVVPDEEGRNVSSFCNETFAKEVNNAVVPVARIDYIRASASGAKVLISEFETLDARNARLQAEKLKEDAERQRYLNSPEGRAEQARIAAAERQKIAEKAKAERELSSFKPY